MLPILQSIHFRITAVLIYHSAMNLGESLAIKTQTDDCSVSLYYHYIISLNEIDAYLSILLV